jgi:hypothetical protein
MSNEDLKKPPLVDAFDFDSGAEEGVEGGDARAPSTQRVIQGERLSFTNDFIWLIGADEEFPKDRELVPVDTIRLVQKWIDQLPAGHIVVEPGKKWPDIDKMNAECPKSEWTKDLNGAPRGPWQRQRVTYFVDLETMQKYTWPVNTVGADICIANFKDKVKLMRDFRGARVFAVVTLGDTFMPTRFGGRQRPEFFVKRWITLGPSEPALPAPTTPALPGQAQPETAAKPVNPQGGIQTVEPPSLKEQMHDEMPPWLDDPLPEDLGGPPTPKAAASSPSIPLPSHKLAVPKPRANKRGVTKIAHSR